MNVTPNRRPTGSARERPPLRHQASVPPEQRCRCDDEGRPLCPRQESAGGHEAEPVGPQHRRPAASSPENGKLVSQYDDF
jgi:hypothetical protein